MVHLRKRTIQRTGQECENRRGKCKQRDINNDRRNTKRIRRHKQEVGEERSSSGCNEECKKKRKKVMKKLREWKKGESSEEYGRKRSILRCVLKKREGK